MAGRLRSLRIPDPVWIPAMARAKREGTNLTTVVVRFLTRYGKGGK